MQIMQMFATGIEQVWGRMLAKGTLKHSRRQSGKFA